MNNNVNVGTKNDALKSSIPLRPEKREPKLLDKFAVVEEMSDNQSILNDGSKIEEKD